MNTDDGRTAGAKGVLVVGLGNLLLGDDGIGIRVVEELGRQELPSGVALADGGTTGLGLVSLMDGFQRVIVVDAADMGRRPGCVVKFSPSEVQFKAMGDTLSLHQVGLGEVLALTEALGVTSPEVTIIGVQPERTAVGEELSPEVERAIPECIRIVMEEVKAADPILR